MKVPGWEPIGDRLRPYQISIVGSALIVASLVLTWLGFRATEEWQRSTRLLVEQRTSEVITLMTMALNRDMRGVESEVLPQLESLVANAAPYEVSDEVTMAFSRFPYPESFFTWSADGTPLGTLYVYSRMERRPTWETTVATPVEFPTTMAKDPPELLRVVRMLQNRASRESRVAFLETRIGNETYQIVARPVYGGPSRTELKRFAGFTVNLDWVRAHYFSELISQLSRVLTAHASVALSVLDEKGAIVTSNLSSDQPKRDPNLPFRDQRFPLLFFDPVLRTSMPAEAIPIRYWTARTEATEDKSLLVAAGGSRRTFLLISIAALAATIAMVLGIRSARAAAQVAAMKSEFVSTVTHELKTPLSSIRLASETLVRGRYRSQEVIAQYAELLLKDVSRLTRTVDNLLSITRLHDVHAFYMFESVDLLSVVEEALSRFQLQLKEQGFELRVDVPACIPPVHGDRAAILQVLDNLLDNAIRYSNGGRTLTLSASVSGNQVSLQIADAGPGIPSDELPRVFDKFFRGRRNASSGSGLGLAIVQRVVNDHGGSIRLRSAPGQGTTAEVLLCVAEGEEVDDEAKTASR